MSNLELIIELAPLSGDRANNVQNQNQLEDHSEYICWHCQKGQEMGILLRPCNCTGYREFMHLTCLQILVDRKKYRYCDHCHFYFPLKRNNQPLLERLRNRDVLLRVFGRVCSILSMIVIWMLIIYNMINIIVYMIMTFDIWKNNLDFIILIISIILFISFLNFFSYYVIRKMMKLFVKLQDSCQLWQLHSQLLLECQSSDIIRETSI